MLLYIYIHIIHIKKIIPKTPPQPAANLSRAISPSEAELSAAASRAPSTTASLPSFGGGNGSPSSSNWQLLKSSWLGTSPWSPWSPWEKMAMKKWLWT